MAEESEGNKEHLNWVDPDVVAYYEASGGGIPSFNQELESEFKRFFSEKWQNPEYDDLRLSWSKVVDSDDPHTRVMGKTALWSLLRYQKRV